MDSGPEGIDQGETAPKALAPVPAPARATGFSHTSGPPNGQRPLAQRQNSDVKPKHMRKENIRSSTASDPGSRRRARQSCDACKSRKTKCIPADRSNAPCKYCASIGRPCSTSVRLQRRPFYRVSEEEYECSMRLLRHYVGPDVTLDLETMKAMLAEIDEGSSGGYAALVPAPASTTASTPTIETEESEVLQEELGCMIIDARGSYRYVGPDSSVRFANAAQITSNGSTQPLPHRADPDPSIIVPLVRSRLPPDTPESVQSSGSDVHAPYPQYAEQVRYHRHDSPTPADPERDRKVYYLPDRDVCQRYCMRFFEELQSIYWFFSPEQFYTMVDKTYADGGVGSSASWLCSLYCIFSICSAKDEVERPDDAFARHRGTKRSSEYLAMAKSMGLQVCDEADDDAVRALALMSLALHSSCYTVTAYLIIGMTVRIAYSLGLHRNIATRNNDSVTRARLQRLWWTVYLLDQEVAIQLGYPCAIVDDVAGLQTPLPCESILDPGRHTPHGYQAVCVDLVKLKKKISHTLYVKPAVSTRKVPFSAVAACMGELRDWLASLPPHLCWSAGMPPSHRRAVAVLHLRYWTTLIHVQRPFLLYTVSRGAELEGDKKRWYEELSVLCLDAADKSVAILRNMRDHSLLSSLVLFDSWCIQELAHVFLLGKQYADREPARAAAADEGLETCVSTLRGMDTVGWADKILPELLAQVAAYSGKSPARSEDAAKYDDVAADAAPAPSTNEAAEGVADGRRESAHGHTQAPSWDGVSGHDGHQASQSGAHSMDHGSMFEYSYFQDFDFNVDAQLDVFDTFDLDMETFVAPPHDAMFFS